jgi:hypothetical protein
MQRWGVADVETEPLEVLRHVDFLSAAAAPPKPTAIQIVRQSLVEQLLALQNVTERRDNVPGVNYRRSA